MAYENYSFVSWTDGTPISSDRLAQMSMNMEQIREANDSKPSGVIEFIETTSGAVAANVVDSNVEIIALTNPDGGSDQRVTIDQNRYYKVTCVFPGFIVNGKGAEDAVLSLKIFNAVQSGYGAASPLMVWDFAIPPYSFYNTAANANTIVESVKATDLTTVGAGTYSIYVESGGGLNANSFSAAVIRTGGTSGLTNAPVVSVTASATNKLQLIVEDAGASV
jgi:hypothetical protein